MRILPASPDGLAEALHVLQIGGVVAHATETCYGLACDLSNLNAVTRLFLIKDRPTTQPVSALFSSAEEAKRFVSWNDEAEELARKYLPGPLTLILPLKEGTPAPLHVAASMPPEKSNKQTIGIRVSSYPVAQALVTGFGSPISTTSANVHGLSNLYSVDDIVSQFASREHQPDLILDSGSLPQTPPSTVIDLTKTDGERIRRKGNI